MNYDIIATLGPSSSTPAIWRAMLDAGVTAFRLNTSHLTLPQLQHWLDRLSSFLVALKPTPPLVLDLQGSKWRLGEFPTCILVPDQHVELIYNTSSDRHAELPVPHLDFFHAAPVSSNEIVLNDAKIRLVRESIAPEKIRARIITGGELSSRKGITFAASDYRQEKLNDKDRAILEQTRHLSFVRYALSYIRDAVELRKYRAHFGNAAYLIAKLERQAALDEAGLMAEVADELWVCRGDLGAELGIRSMAEAVRHLSSTIGALPIPAFMAGQVLEHMTEHAAPTRSEVCYLHDVLLEGYRGVVLSDEVAIGLYPIESCRVAAMFRD